LLLPSHVLSEIKKYLAIFIPCLLALPLFAADTRTVRPPPEPLPEHTWQQIRSLRGIATQDGMTAPSLYVFFDPNCPFSAKLWQKQVNGKPFGEVPAIWVPVTYIGQTALGKGAALLRASSRVELARNFKEFNFEHREGATTPVAYTEAEWLALGRSKAVWYKLGGATPTLVYRHKAGETLFYPGGPSDPAKWAELVGSLATDNVLKRRLNDYQVK